MESLTAAYENFETQNKTSQPAEQQVYLQQEAYVRPVGLSKIADGRAVVAISLCCNFVFFFVFFCCLFAFIEVISHFFAFGSGTFVFSSVVMENMRATRDRKQSTSTSRVFS